MEHIIRISWIIGIGAIAWAVLYFILYPILAVWLVPAAGITVDDWLNNFHFLGVIILVVATIVSLFWYILAAWVFKTDDWRQVNKRAYWGLLLIPIAITVIVAALMLDPAQEKKWIAVLFYALLGLLCYLFATAFNSPPAFKYIPWRPKALRGF